MKDLWFRVTKKAMIHTNIAIPHTTNTPGDLHNFSRASKNKKIVLSLCVVTKTVIMKNWIALSTPIKKEWITEAIEMIKLEKTAFRLQNNETEYYETWTPVEV